MRRPALLLLALALLALIVWVLLGDGLPGTGSVDVADPGAEEDDATLRRAEGLPEGAADARAPSLRVEADRPRREPRRGDVRVRVIGRGGRPIPTVTVRTRSAPDRHQEAITDAEGVAVLRDLPFDGTRLVTFRYGGDPRAMGLASVGRLPPAPGQAAAVPVTGPDLIYRAAAGFNVAVHVVEADTGRARAEAEVWWRADRRNEQQRARGAPARFYVMPRDHRLFPGYRVTPPAGFVAYDEMAFMAEPCVYASECTVVYPLRRALQATLVSRHAQGRVVRADLSYAEVGGRGVKLASHRDGFGNVQLDGIPFLREEPLHVVVRDETLGAVGALQTRLPSVFGRMPSLEVTLKDEPASRDEAVEESRETENGLPYDESFGVRRSQQAVRARLRVHVKRHNGEPAVGARVMLTEILEEHQSPSGPRWISTDVNGVARTSNPPEGRVIVEVEQRGFLDIRTEILMPPSGTKDVTLVEPAGGRLRVTVVDKQGVALPYATVELLVHSRNPYVDLVDGVQRLDRFVDHEGRRVFTRVPVGDLTYVAAWGSRRHRGTLTIKANATHDVRIVLARADK